MDWTAFSAFLNSNAGSVLLLIAFTAVVLYFNGRADHR